MLRPWRRSLHSRAPTRSTAAARRPTPRAGSRAGASRAFRAQARAGRRDRSLRRTRRARGWESAHRAGAALAEMSRQSSLRRLQKIAQLGVFGVVVLDHLAEFVRQAGDDVGAVAQ